MAAYAYNCKAVPVLGYVAQLLPPPDDFRRVETNALHTLTHMATNAFTYDNFFGLHLFGGPKLRCVGAQAHAAMVRAATVNVQCWHTWKPQLEKAANLSLSLHLAFGDRCSPDFWDTDPIAINLSRAYSCNPELGDFSSATEGALKLICNGSPPPDPAQFPPTPKIQSIVYEAIMKHALDSDPEPTITRRIRDMFPPMIPPPFIMSSRTAARLCVVSKKPRLSWFSRLGAIHGLPRTGFMSLFFCPASLDAIMELTSKHTMWSVHGYSSLCPSLGQAPRPILLRE